MLKLSFSHGGVRSNRTSRDAELVRKSLTGDSHAFEALVDQYRNLVFSVALTSTKSLAEAEELAQETFIVAWSRLSDLRDHERFRNWLCGITRILARRIHHRRARHHHELEVPRKLQLAQVPSNE